MTHFDTGEKYVTKVVFGTVTQEATLHVGLYNSSDALSESAGTTNITTEPAGGSYSRQGMPITGMTLSATGGDYMAQLTGTLTYAMGDSTNPVDSYFAIVNFKIDSGSVAEDHLFWDGTLDQTYDLNSIDSFELTNVGAKVT